MSPHASKQLRPLVKASQTDSLATSYEQSMIHHRLVREVVLIDTVEHHDGSFHTVEEIGRQEDIITFSLCLVYYPNVFGSLARHIVDSVCPSLVTHH